MTNIRQNKNRGRIFEGKVKEAFESFSFVYKSGVSTKGVDLIAITKLGNLDIIFLVEAKDKKERYLTSKEVRNILNNFKSSIENILSKTNLIPLPILVAKVKKDSYGDYLLCLFKPFKVEEGFMFGFFKSLRELISFLFYNLNYILEELDKKEPFIFIKENNIIGLRELNLKEKGLKLDF